MNLQEQAWQMLRGEIERVDRKLDRLTVSSQRAETAGGVPSALLAAAPTAAVGGLSSGDAYIDLLWIRDGRKPGEVAGAGTGVLAVWQSGAWRRVGDYTAVVT